MLQRFDWLRLSQTGAELLATLQYAQEEPEFPRDPGQLAPPLSALHSPCQRCGVFPPLAQDPNARYCRTCQEVLTRARRLGRSSRQALVLWGWVHPFPRQLRPERGFQDSSVWGAYIHDENRFLLMLNSRELKPWLQELVLYHGPELKGLIQVFPTVGNRNITMDELLCRVVHHEARFPLDRLRVRFFSAAHQIFRPHVYDQAGVLTFEIAEFLEMLEMAAVFRTVLLPEDQQLLHEFLYLEDPAQAQFYWGRLLGYLNQEARDMLQAWRVRNWTRPQVDLFYALVEHVSFYSR